MSIKNIAITGAAGNIAYSLVFRLLSKLPIVGADKINLRLLDIEPSIKALTGLKYEIEDSAFTSLNKLLVTDKAENAFEDADYILMVGAKPRSQGMERSDLILDNANIFQTQAKVINEVCNNNTKVIVVGNPANTNALILNYNTPNIPNQNITSLMKLDQNRAKSILASKMNTHVSKIKQMVIWGNHSTTQVPDLFNCNIDSRQINMDDDWVFKSFIPKVQKRGGEIIEYRGSSSAASAASAIYDHLYILENGSEDWESLGIMSEGQYNTKKDLMFSLPVKVSSESYHVIEDINVQKSISNLIKISENELVNERDIIREYLP